MSEAITALITFILTFVLVAWMEVDARKDWPKTGYVVIDKKAYRLVPVD